MNEDDPMLTIRIPQSSWRGIVNGIEKWAGRPADDIDILLDYLVVDEALVADKAQAPALPTECRSGHNGRPSTV